MSNTISAVLDTLDRLMRDHLSECQDCDFDKTGMEGGAGTYCRYYMGMLAGKKVLTKRLDRQAIKPRRC